MTDVERELLEMFERRARDVLDATPPAAPVVRRTRRRQAATVAVACVVIAGVVLVPIAGSRLGDDAAKPVVPAMSVDLPQASAGFRAAALPYASIAYPQRWYLLDTTVSQPGGDRTVEAVPGPVLQLANFDPDIPHSPRCMAEPDSIPADGVLLTVGITDETDLSLTAPGDWPASLGPYPPDVDPVCAQMHEQAAWRAPSGVVYWASAGWGGSASQDDIDSLHRAFESLLFPPTSQPWIEPMGSVANRATPRAVLDSTTLGDDVLTFVAYLELDRVLWVGVESNGNWNAATAPHTGSQPDEPVQAGLSIVGENAALLHGVIAPKVGRVEVRTESGDAVPMHVNALPASLGADRYVWALVPGAGDRSTVVGYDRNGEPIGNPVYPVGPDVTIAEGTHPVGGPWQLFITTSNDGAGLSFAFEEHGAGGGCCMRPLGDNDLYQLGFSSSSDRSIPQDIEGLASTAVARVEYVHTDGREFEGALYPIPDRFIGPANALLIFVPGDVPIDGRVVAYDASGTVLQRQPVSASFDEPGGPTREIDAVWTALRAARDAVSRYLKQADTLAGVTPEDMRALVPNVTFNASARAVPNEVSLRGATDREIALVSATGDGDVYCIAVEATEGGGNYGYGRQDAATPGECAGGWG
jgi:hypothetical protein